MARFCIASICRLFSLFIINLYYLVLCVLTKADHIRFIITAFTGNY